ncbi:hypothetical protein BDR04DRAFT_1095553 [Suillus decipiens]|nr:hypothetical protein BDR04DRAFT_1095553 [Suillus decipiens]
MRMLCYSSNVDDFTDAARVAVSPVSTDNRTCLPKISQTYEGNSSERYSIFMVDCRLHKGHEDHPK